MIMEVVWFQVESSVGKQRISRDSQQAIVRGIISQGLAMARILWGMGYIARMRTECTCPSLLDPRWQLNLIVWQLLKLGLLRWDKGLRHWLLQGSTTQVGLLFFFSYIGAESLVIFSSHFWKNCDPELYLENSNHRITYQKWVLTKANVCASSNQEAV